MDRKGILVLLISFALLMLWFPLVNKLYPPVPVPQSTNMVGLATNLPTPGAETNLAPPVPVQPIGPDPFTPAKLTPTGTPEKEITLENEEMRLTFSSHGGGLKLVELMNHPQSISCSRAEPETENFITLNTEAPLPVLTVLGGPAIQGDGVFSLSRKNGGIRLEKALTNGLALVKEFQLESNFLVTASVRLENRSDQALALPTQHWIAGTATPMNQRDKGMYMGVYWYDGEGVEHVDGSWFANRFLGCFPGTPRTRYQAGANNISWTAVHNQFYTLILIPEQPAEQMLCVQTNLPPPSPESIRDDSKIIQNPTGYLASLVYPATNISAGTVLERSFRIYAGPKQYNTLARLGQRMENDLDLIMGYSGFFGFFAKALLLSMNGVHSLGFSYGLAIIIITIIIKILFWPLTNASTKSMKRMAALQPQMKALQERFKDDPAKMNRKLMEFMKENKVSPLGGCLPMLLQIPVFFGFYRMILSATELRGARFLWACDLSRPDTLFIIPGLNLPFNPLPLIMGATMLWQARMTPPSPGMDPVQQKIMKYLPLMFLVILYNFSAGLTLYWTVQNLLTIAQMKLTRSKNDPATPAPVKPVPGRPQPGRPSAGKPSPRPGRRSHRKRK